MTFVIRTAEKIDSGYLRPTQTFRYVASVPSFGVVTTAKLDAAFRFQTRKSAGGALRRAGWDPKRWLVLSEATAKRDEDV